MRVRRAWGQGSPGTIAGAAVMAISLSAVPTDAQARRGAAGGPAVQVEVVDGRVRMNGDAFVVRLAVLIPPGHHGYVDRGDDGFYIPFTFTFPALDGAGAESTERARPEGVRDDKVRAFVLRGRGEFEFELRSVEAVSAVDRLEARLRYQVCNDRTGICYPPRTLTIPIPLTPAPRWKP